MSRRTIQFYTTADEIMKPMAIDLFCGLGGWTDGLLAEGYDVIGFDIERHRYPKFRAVSDECGVKLPGNNAAVNWCDRPISRLKDAKGDAVEGEWQEYPAQLVLQDVLTLHGSQFRNAALIVASPPCQEYSYMAMPWTRAKAKAAAIRADQTGEATRKLTALFDACFRLQREASEAAGRHIPLVVENVKGAQPWVGRARANFGSFYLWGDVGMVGNRVVCGPEFGNFTKPIRAGRKNDGGSWFAIGSPGQTETGKNPVRELAGRKVDGFNFHEHEKTGKPGRSFQSAAVGLTTGPLVDGYKGVDGKSWIRDKSKDPRPNHGNTPARKAASAQIAKIPFELACYIARVYKPEERAA